MEGNDKKEFAKRLSEIALQHARVPPTGSDFREHHLVHCRPWTSWKILFAMGVLHDGMSLAKATEILGEPRRDKTFVNWYYNSMMHVNPNLNGEITQGVGGETVHFTNEQRVK